MSDCAYCTGEARGVDEEGAFTCGNAFCSAIVAPMPIVVECSNEDEDEE